MKRKKPKVILGDLMSVPQDMLHYVDTRGTRRGSRNSLSHYYDDPRNTVA